MLVAEGSRDTGCSRCGYGELGKAPRFLNASGVMSAGPLLPPTSLEMRGAGLLNAAAEIVRVPGGIGEERDEDDLFAGR